VSVPVVLMCTCYLILMPSTCRCVDAEAYEVKREDVSNGIFISFLKKRVCVDEKVTVMLDRVAEGRAGHILLINATAVPHAPIWVSARLFNRTESCMLYVKAPLFFPDMGRCELTRGRQALELRSNLSERRSLTDKIQISDCSASQSARNLQWAVAHGNVKHIN